MLKYRKRQVVVRISGLSFDEGQFSVVGYVTEGADVLSQVENGDIIEKVEIPNIKKNNGFSLKINNKGFLNSSLNFAST